MSARVYFVTGKGGTGKTSLSCALTEILSEKIQEPILLLRMNSFSLSQGNYEPAKQKSEKVWEQDLHLHRTVEEYFTVTLGKIPLPSFFQKVAAKLNEEVASRLLSNRYILKFIEACPGLTPTIFLGKVCYEAQSGAPDLSKPHQKWGAIVVDAPSTGQALQVFESARTLSKVLSQGVIYRHIHQTLEYAYSEKFEIFLLTLPEEGPVQECLETVKRFEKISFLPKRIWINKVSPQSEKQKLEAFLEQKDIDQSDLKKLVQVDLERIKDQQDRIEDLKSKLSHITLTCLSETSLGDSSISKTGSFPLKKEEITL